MTPTEFCYWLQGYFELSSKEEEPAEHKLTPQQVESIKNHLNLVFYHSIDPEHEKGMTKEQIEKMQEVHDGKKSEHASSLQPNKWLLDHRPGLIRC